MGELLVTNIVYILADIDDRETSQLRDPDGPFTGTPPGAELHVARPADGASSGTPKQPRPPMNHLRAPRAPRAREVVAARASGQHLETRFGYVWCRAVSAWRQCTAL